LLIQNEETRRKRASVLTCNQTVEQKHGKQYTILISPGRKSFSVSKEASWASRSQKAGSSVHRWGAAVQEPPEVPGPAVGGEGKTSAKLCASMRKRKTIEGWWGVRKG